MASQFGYLNYSPCRLEAEMKATSEINAEVRQALGLKPGESLVQGAKDAKTKANQFEEADAKCYELSKKLRTAEDDVERLRVIANDRFGALRDVRKMLNGRAMDPIQDVVRRYIDRHSSKDSEYLANLQATWLEVAEAVGYDIKNGDDASLVSLVEDLAEFKADAVKKYKKEHPYAPNDSPVDNELLSWIQNMANDRKYLAKLLKQISDGDYPLPPLVIEKKLTRKQQTKIDTYDDLVKMFGPESDGMVWMTVNKLKNDLAKANETPSRDTNTHIANMLRKAFNTKNKVIYKGEKLQEFFDKAKTSTISELMELVEQIDRIK